MLLANHLDPTLLMNVVALEFGKRFELQYTNNYRPVELFLNDEYQGSYLLTEQVEVAANRVNVNKKTGFLIEMDAYFDEEWRFISAKYKLPIMLKAPDYSGVGDQAIKKAINDLEGALISPSFPDNNYKDLIDVPSLINFLLVNEIVGNDEVKYPKSTYMHKEADGKFYMGPLWDFDWAFGHVGSGFVYFSNAETLLFHADAAKTDERPGIQYFSRYFDDPEFCRQYKARWNVVKDRHVKTILTFVDQQAALLQKSQSHNFSVWPNKLDHNSEITKMKAWLEQRIAYLDKEINKL